MQLVSRLLIGLMTGSAIGAGLAILSIRSAVGRQHDAKRLDLAMTRIDEAQRMAGQLDQGANAHAAVTAKTIEEVRGADANGRGGAD